MGFLADQATPFKTPKHLTTPGPQTRHPAKINLRAVAEVLKDNGLDPTEEIVKVLQAVDKEGRPVIPSDLRAKINLELLQYIAPKLKSIEVKAKIAATAFDVNDAQARSIAEAFLQSSALSDEELLK